MANELYDHTMYFGDFTLREVDGLRMEIEHQISGKTWHFPIDDVDNDPLSVIRSGEAITDADITNHANDASAHHTRYTDQEAIQALSTSLAGKADYPHGPDAHVDDYVLSGGHGDAEHSVDYVHRTTFTDHSNDPSGHHTRYTDTEARAAIDADLTSIENTLADKADRTGDNINAARLVASEIHRDELESDTLTLGPDGTLTYNLDTVYHEGNLNPVVQSVFADHEANASAHHTRYTDTEAQAAVSGVYSPSPHGNEEHSVDYLDTAHATQTGTHGVTEIAGVADVTAHSDKTIGVHGVGDSPVASTDDITTQITTHSGNAGAHHNRYTDTEAQNALSTDLARIDEELANRVMTSGDRMTGDLIWDPDTSPVIEFSPAATTGDTPQNAVLEFYDADALAQAGSFGWDNTQSAFVLSNDNAGTQLSVGTDLTFGGKGIFDSLQSGKTESETIPATGSTLQFTTNDTRNLHDSTDVSLTNSTTASVTEDITANYYEGIDNTGTLISSETQSVTIAAGASTTATFFLDDFSLDSTDYYVEVTQSGTGLSIDGIDENVRSTTYTTEKDMGGDLVITDHDGRERARYDSLTAGTTFPAMSVTSSPTSTTDVARKQETDAVQSNLDTHAGDTTNPHTVTATQTGAVPDTGGNFTGAITVEGSVSSFGDIIAYTNDDTAIDGGVGGTLDGMDLLLDNNEPDQASYGEDRIYFNYSQTPEYSTYKSGVWGLRIEHTADAQTLAFWNWDNGNVLEIPSGMQVSTSLQLDGNNVYHEGNLDPSTYALQTDFTTHTGDASAHHTRPVAGTNITEDANANFNIAQGSGSGLDADLLDGTESAEFRERSQSNVALPTSEIPAGDHAAIPIHVPAGETLEVWSWGCRTDAQTTPVGLTVELYDETNAVSIASANTAHATGVPIASIAGGVDVTLRLNNGTGAVVNAGAKFGYTRR